MKTQDSQYQIQWYASLMECKIGQFPKNYKGNAKVRYFTLIILLYILTLVQAANKAVNSSGGCTHKRVYETGQASAVMCWSQRSMWSAGLFVLTLWVIVVVFVVMIPIGIMTKTATSKGLILQP